MSAFISPALRAVYEADTTEHLVELIRLTAPHTADPMCAAMFEMMGDIVRSRTVRVEIPEPKPRKVTAKLLCAALDEAGIGYHLGGVWYNKRAKCWILNLHQWEQGGMVLVDAGFNVTAISADLIAVAPTF